MFLGFAGLGRAAAGPQGEAKAKAQIQRAVRSSQKPSEKATPTKPAPSPQEERLRDPFSIPKPVVMSGVENQASEEISHPCPGGTRCLVIGQLQLEGIVRVGSKMIAVLANPAHRAYFLHENEPLYNGTLTRITPDAVYFTEEYHDASGKVATREVVRQLAAPPGEKK